MTDPRVVSERFVTLFTERAVGAILSLDMFDTWALDHADQEDRDTFLEAGNGQVCLCRDDDLIIYQNRSEPICHVRAMGIDQSTVEERMRVWADATTPPFIEVEDRDPELAMMLFGPHPTSGHTSIILSFPERPLGETEVQAHASVAWVDEEDDGED